MSYAELVAGLKDPEFAEEAGFYGSGMSRGEFAAEFCDALDWDGDRTVDWFEFRDEAMGKALDAMHDCGWSRRCARCSIELTSRGMVPLP